MQPSKRDIMDFEGMQELFHKLEDKTVDGGSVDTCRGSCDVLSCLLSFFVMVSGF